MKRGVITGLFALFLKSVIAQTTISDPWHTSIVNQNGIRRLTAELTYQASLNTIRKNTDDIAINLTSVSLIQTMIHRSLTEVNEALKDAIQIKNLGYLVNDIYKNSNEALELAKGNPTLMLFAERTANELKGRGVTLVTEVSQFVLSKDKEILINYNVRDELIKKVVEELQIMNALIYTIKTNMYWAKQRGLIRSLNPYQQFIDRDKALIDDILLKRQLLKY